MAIFKGMTPARAAMVVAGVKLGRPDPHAVAAGPEVPRDARSPLLLPSQRDAGEQRRPRVRIPRRLGRGGRPTGIVADLRLPLRPGRGPNFTEQHDQGRLRSKWNEPASSTSPEAAATIISGPSPAATCALRARSKW